ncbi:MULTISPECIES: SitI3 family protein [Brevibacillus]|uniref:SitI3 family protein n=1 Tax=Brevibacillus TaxID=55080 RepID=UPI00362D6BA9
MALEYSLLLEDHVLSKDTILDELNKLGYSCEKIECLQLGFTIYDTYEKAGFSLSLLDTSCMAFGYEFEYLPDPFMDKQDLCFRINKFYDWEHAITNILTIIFNLLAKVQGSAIFECNGETIHLLRRNGVLYINEDTGFWKNENFLRFVNKFDYEILKAPNQQ